MKNSYHLKLSFSLLFLILFTFCSDDDDIQYQLTTQVVPEGAGSISPASGLLNKGTKVEIKAMPGEEYVFTNWSDDAAGDENPMTVVMTDDMVITANFEKKTYTLTIEIQGEGTVKEEIVQAKTSTDYPSGTNVQLTAIPEDGWEFVRWEEIPIWVETENPMVLEIAWHHNVTAIFQKLNYVLEIEILGQGTVKEEVIANKSSTEYPTGTTVQLTAIPEEEWEFEKWTGDYEGNENPLEVLMNEPMSLTAMFKTLNQEKVFIPDDNFEQALIDLGLDDVMDDYVKANNVANLVELDISGKNISNLTGLEAFILLQDLNCSNNNISDVSSLAGLDRIINLDCSNNNISSIPKSFGTVWGIFPPFVDGKLDLSDNNLNELDVSELNFFTYLDVRNNPLSCIQVNEDQIMVYIDDPNIYTDEGVLFSLDCGN